MRFPVIPFLIVTAVTVAGGISPTFAQGPGGGPPPFGGPGGPGGGPGGRGGFGGPGGPGRMGPGRELTVVSTPLEALDAYLNLSDAQRTRIEKAVEQVRSQMPRPPGPPQEGGAPPERPSREEMEARMQKVQAAEQKASREIEASLTAGQRAKLPTLLKALTALRADRIALPAAGQLRLSDAQIAKLAGLGERATHEQVAAVLSAEQNEIADANRMQRGGPGGPGGRGGRGGGRGPGGPGGFPGGPGGPPEGGPGFPPPPPGGDGQ